MTQTLTTKLKSAVAAFTALALSLALVPASAFAATGWTGTAVANATGSITITGSDLSTDSGDYTVYRIGTIDRATNNNTTSLNATDDSISSALSAWAESDGSSTAASDLISAVRSASGLETVTPSVTSTSGGVVLTGDFTPGVYYIQIASTGDTIYSPIIVSVEPTYSGGAWTGVEDVETSCKSASTTIKKEMVDSNVAGDVYAENDTIDFKVTFDVASSWSSYVLTDTMGAGLKYQSNSIALYDSDGDLKASGDSANTYYTFTAASNGQGFTLTLTSTAIEELGSGAYITYTAVVQEGASSDNLYNTIVGEYDGGQTGGGGTIGGDNDPDATVNVAAGIEIIKFDEAGGRLNGATFTIYSNAACTTSVGTVTITSGGSAKSTVPLVATKTYYVKETVAPSGYVLYSGTLTVYASGTTGLTGDDYVLTAGEYTTIEVTNVASDSSFGDGSGIGLPTTGGMGTILFTVLGVLIMAGAASVIIRSRKQQQQG